MSILPSQAQRPASSSSQAPSQNPNPNHGSSPITFGSLNISDSSLHQPSFSSAAQDSGGSSKQVTQFEIPNGKRTSPQQNRQSKGKMSEPPRNHQGSGSHGSTPHSAGRRAQANYKFVVLDTGNYSPESMDPDKMLQWEDIIYVRYSTPFPVQCPICLEYPLCPQITSCGHIFCFPCILQYLFMDKLDQKDDCCKRCPLCFMIVSSKDLYTIYIENVRQCCVGDDIEFMLLTRQKDSFALFQKKKEEKDMHSCNNEMDDMFSKFTFTSDVNLSVRKAISDLDGWLARADSGLVDDLEKLPYVCAAMEQLEQRKKHWNEQQAYNSKQSQRNTDSKARSIELEETANAWGDIHDARCLGQGKLSANDADAKTAVTYLTIKKSNGRTSFDQNAVGESFEVQDTLLSSSCDENKSLEGHSSSSNSGKDNDSYNFYQAVDGQHIILHPLNMKCLLHHYGTYDLLPQRVSGRILELETVTQSEAMRRRYRYLSHFSLTTTFQLCEIDLSRVLPPEALLPFLDEIKKREKQRKQLARKEQKEKIKAEVAASASAVQFMPMVSNFGQSSCDDSPTFSMDDFEALGSSAIISTSPPVTGERKLFSSVTRLGFAAGHDSPALKIEEANAEHKSEVSNDSPRLRNSGSGTPSFATMISRAKSIENLDAAAKMNENGNERGKKGKKASRVLMSTAGGRRY
ncbi:hypothetical protein SLA2020_409310 [Shorea laevis]